MEEEVKISKKVLRTMGRVTVHSDIQVETFFSSKKNLIFPNTARTATCTS